MNKITIKQQADTLIRAGKIKTSSYVNGESRYIVSFGGQIYSVTYGKKIIIEYVRREDQ